GGRCHEPTPIRSFCSAVRSRGHLRRARTRPDAASDSSLREFVEVRERGVHGFHCAQRGRSLFTRRPGGRTRRIEACARIRKSGCPGDCWFKRETRQSPFVFAKVLAKRRAETYDCVETC